MYVSRVYMCNILKPVLTYLNKDAVRQMKISICLISLTTDVTLLMYCLKKKSLGRDILSLINHEL